MEQTCDRGNEKNAGRHKGCMSGIAPGICPSNKSARLYLAEVCIKCELVAYPMPQIHMHPQSSTHTSSRSVYIFGGGAVGLTLAAYLTAAGREATLVRTSKSKSQVKAGKAKVSIDHGREPEPLLNIEVPMLSMDQLDPANEDITAAIAVITSKSYANEIIAAALKDRGFAGSIVILQNGVDVEAPFIQAGFNEVHRCVLYVTSQTLGEHHVKFRPISSCGVGVIHGTEADRDDCVRGAE